MDDQTNNTDSSPDHPFGEKFLSTLSLIFALLMIFMCLVGALMNIISLCIFTSRSFRKRSINILLCGLSASDLCLCILAVPVFSFTQLDTIIQGIPINITSRILLYLYPLTIMAQTCSVWVLVAITIDRYLAICHVFLMRVYCTRTRALITLASILVFSIGYNFCRFWEYTINDDADMGIVGLLRDNQLYMILYQNISMLLSQFILPLVVLCILNLQVARTILKAGETRRELISSSEKREFSTAKMIFYVVIIFLCCYSLSFLLNVWEIFNPTLFKEPVGFLLNDVNNILVVINSSSSFIFYTKYSSRYRAQLKKMPIISFIAYHCCLIRTSTHFSEKSDKNKSEYANISSYSTKHTYTSANSSMQKHTDRFKSKSAPEQIL